MSTDTIRRAAAAMRERAEAATPDYALMPSRVDIDQQGTCDGCAQSADLVAAYPDPDNEPWLCADCAAQADHDAAWHPDVALAVADWLDGVTEWLERGWCSTADAVGGRALVVARTYLKEEA